MIVFIKECTRTSVQGYVDDGLCQAADAQEKCASYTRKSVLNLIQCLQF